MWVRGGLGQIGLSKEWQIWQRYMLVSVISRWCKGAKTGSAGIETRVSVFIQLTRSVQIVSNEKRLPMVVMLANWTLRKGMGFWQRSCLYWVTCY